MKDIQKDLISLLSTIDNLKAYNRAPLDFTQDENIAIVYELDNIPHTFTDGVEYTSTIIYNIDLYCKNAETHIYRKLIDEKLNDYGMVRLAGGRDSKVDNLYYRALSYKINL